MLYHPGQTPASNSNNISKLLVDSDAISVVIEEVDCCFCWRYAYGCIVLAFWTAAAVTGWCFVTPALFLIGSHHQGFAKP